MEKMNRIPVVVRNQAYMPEVIPEDVDEVDPADLTPLVSGDTPIVIAPASEDGEVAEDEVEDTHEELVKEVHLVEELGKEVQILFANIDALKGCLRTSNVDKLGDASTCQPLVVPDINVWDTGRAWEREYCLYTEASRDDLNIRLHNQIWDMLQKMQEQMDNQSWNTDDKYIVDGLINILVLNVKINKLTDKVLRDQVNAPSKLKDHDPLLKYDYALSSIH